MNAFTDPSGDPKHVVVATHGHCFDGLCSAVMFTRLRQHIDRTKLRFTYTGCGYGPGQSGVDPKVLAGDENAILDFRFSSDAHLTWYFDHHVSAFQGGTGERAAYETRAQATPRRFFHDGAYGSCTKLIADIGARDFGLDLASEGASAKLVAWADMIDSASFPSAAFAVERADPVLQMMAVVEHLGDDAFLTRMVPRLLAESVEDVARSAEIQSLYAPLGAEHRKFIETVRAAGKEKDGVVLVDLTDRLLDVAGKFVTYALYPDSAYSVIVSRSKSKCKISIGYNPWAKKARTHDIASICERWGGGGHAVVGAISLPADQAAKAREVAQTIVDELAK
jgi:hypothetical protein